MLSTCLVQQTKVEIIRLLRLESGANCNLYHVQTRTPFFEALRLVSLKFIKLLLVQGAKIRSVGELQKTALHYAVLNPRVDVVQFILDKRLDIESADCDGRSALFDAVGCKNLEVCEVLLKRGVNVNKPDRYNDTPVTLAIEGDQDAFVRVSLEYGAKVTDKIRGTSLLRIAVESSSSATVNLLIEQIVKAEHLNVGVNECDKRLIENDSGLRAHYDKCK